MDYDSDYPIILGLAGKAGTGKTSTANILAPKTQFVNGSFEEKDALIDSNSYMSFFSPDMVWDHKFYAMPLYKLVSIKRGTEGDMRRDRILYQIHATLLEIFSDNPLYGAPPYSDLVDLTVEVADMSIPLEEKPRTFLQNVGTMCRDIDPDCFVKAMKRSIYSDFLEKKKEHNQHSTVAALVTPDEPVYPFNYVCIVSDIRMENEARMISEQPNGMVIKLEASDHVRMDRLVTRDGHTPQNLNHITEAMAIDEDLFDAVVDTDNLTMIEQAIEVKKIMSKLVQ